MKLLFWIVVALVAAVLALFAISNREAVPLGLWPLPFELALPPYLPVLAALLIAFVSALLAPSSPGPLLLMPAWQAGGALGIKIVTVFPDNARRSLPAVYGTYVLLDAATGMPLALLDGTALTLRRTAAASALAADFLARRDSAVHLMVGTGALAPHLVAPHAAARPILQTMICGRDPKKAAALPPPP